MQTNPAIFDLLLGLPQGDLNAVPLAGDDRAKSPLPFDQLLANMAAQRLGGKDQSFGLGVEIDQALPLTSDGDEATPISNKQPFSLLAEMLQAEAEPTAELATRVVKDRGLSHTGPAGSTPANGSTHTRGQMFATVQGQSAGVDSSISEELPVIADTDVRDIEAQRLLGLIQQPRAIGELRSNNLPVGNYKILAVAEVGDRVEMTVQGVDENIPPIKLSLPVDMARQLIDQEIQQRGIQQQTIPTRLAVHQATTPSSEIASLLQKLNLKVLTVRPQEPAQGSEKVATESVKDGRVLEFHGQPDGKRVVFDLTVPRRSLTVRTPVESEKPVLPSAGRDPIESLPGRAAPRADVIPQTAIGKAAEPTGWPKPFTGFEFNQKSGDATGDGEAWANQLTSVRRSGGASDPSLTQRLQPSRCPLPDNIAQQFKANGRSITIGIEPDQLGPAKLHLSVNNHTLTARLTVETSLAKSIVENSLDQLHQQLERAGVKVDTINVHVSGGDTNTNLFEQRQQAAFNRARLSSRMTERIITQEMNAATETLQPGPSQYIGAGGVNVYA